MLQELENSERYAFEIDCIEGLQVERIVGDPQFHPNTNDVFRYKCEFGLLMSIVDSVVEGQDCVDDMHKFLGSEGHFELLTIEGGDTNGRIFSKLESTVFAYNDFAGFVEPSIGTVWRYAKAKKIEGQPLRFLAYLIVPGEYFQDAWDGSNDFKRRRKQLKIECAKAGLKLVENIVTWKMLPKEKKLYFGSLGWKMHEFECCGMGLELNPDVAAVLNISIINSTNEDGYRAIKYTKNLWMHDMKYYDEPMCYRYHGVDYMRSHKLPYELGLSLFNVVSSTDLYLTGCVRSSEDLTFAHCSRRIVVPRITHYNREAINGINYKFLCAVVNGVERICDVAEPIYELSTRRRVLKLLGKQVPVYDGKNDFAVLSSINSVYVNMSAKKGLETRRYLCSELNFPSAWMCVGNKWILRAYPNAIRSCDERDVVPVDEFIKDKKGKWFNFDGCNWVRIPDNDLYDQNLQVVLSFGKQSQYYYVSGDKTKVWYEHDDGVDLVQVHTPHLQLSRLCVTVRFGHDIFGNTDILFAENTAVNTKVFDDVVVFTFANDQRAYEFMRINSHMKKKMWRGDLRKFYHFPDPMSNGYMLVPNVKYFVDGSLFTIPLEVNQVMDIKGVYDSVGNFFAESSGHNVFGDFDYEDMRLLD